MIPSVSQYAGQQLLTGQQAEAYADHFIAQHITDMSGGKTYSQLSAESIAQPNNTKLAGLVATVFKGETLRSMLLNAYGWWKVSQITYIASLAAFGLAGLTFLGSLAALTLGRKPEITHEVITGTEDIRQDRMTRAAQPARTQPTRNASGPRSYQEPGRRTRQRSEITGKAPDDVPAYGTCHARPPWLVRACHRLGR